MSAEVREEAVITDLVERVVEGKVLPQTGSDAWRIVDYELAELGRGRGLVIGPWRAGKLTLRLGVQGHCRINLVGWYADLRLKLSGDRCFKRLDAVREGFRRIGTDDIYRESYYDAEEVFWREADLTDQDLILDGSPDSSLLAIRLIPIDPPAPDTRRVASPMCFTLDGCNMTQHVHETQDDIFEPAERVPQDSCVSVMVYGGMSGDICYHETKVGTQTGALCDQDAVWDPGGRTVCENLKRWREWGKNPAVAMVEYAHQRGWELHFYQRLGWDNYVPGDNTKKSRFFLEHPEFHTVGPSGEKVMGLSVAYPEVVEHLADFYAELAGFGADGVSPCFIRACPMVLYEPIMVEGFQKEYGKDSRELPRYDADWQDYRAKIVTNFMRRAKESLGNCRLSPIIHGTQALNRRFALDVAAWVSEGIVDDLFIMGHQYDHHDCHFAGGPEHIEFDYFHSLPGRNNVRLWPMFYPFGTTENCRKFGYNFSWEIYCQAFHRYMDQGADGYGLWDATTLDRDTNIFDLGNEPRLHYKSPNRLVRKYERIQWDGYLWNRWSPVESG